MYFEVIINNTHPIKLFLKYLKSVFSTIKGNVVLFKIFLFVCSRKPHFNNILTERGVNLGNSTNKNIPQNQYLKTSFLHHGVFPRLK